MKTQSIKLFLFLVLFSQSVLASSGSSRVDVKTKRNSNSFALTITGDAADKLFDNLDDKLMDSADAESSKGRPVWKTGKNLYCIKYVMGSKKVPTSCTVTFDKNGSAAFN